MATSDPSRVRWEYLSKSQGPGEGPEDLLNNLNELGAEGWEAFGVVQELVVDPTELGQRHLYPHGITVFLKRALAAGD